MHPVKFSIWKLRGGILFWWTWWRNGEITWLSYIGKSLLLLYEMWIKTLQSNIHCFGLKFRINLNGMWNEFLIIVFFSRHSGTGACRFSKTRNYGGQQSNALWGMKLLQFYNNCYLDFNLNLPKRHLLYVCLSLYL